MRSTLAGAIATSSLLLLLFSACEVRFGYADREWCTTCTLPNAKAACLEGRCVLDACYLGYGDCNGLSSDGCETNLRVSLFQCGACNTPCADGHGCLDGRCERPFEITNTMTTANTVLLAVDETHVYWAIMTSMGGASTIRRAPKAGGAQELVAYTQLIVSLRVDDSYVYWLEWPGARRKEARVLRVEKSRPLAEPTTLSFLSGVVDPNFEVLDGALYFDVATTSGDQLQRVPPGGGAAQAVMGWDGSGELVGLQRSGEALVFGHFDSKYTNQSIVEYTPGDARFTVLASSLRALPFTVDAEFVYYRDFDTQPVTAAAFRTITVRTRASGATRILTTLTHEYDALRIDRGALFAFSFARGTLSRVALDGSSVRVLFGEQTNGAGFGLDESFVYFVDESRILRLPR